MELDYLSSIRKAKSWRKYRRYYANGRWHTEVVNAFTTDRK